MPKYRAYCWQYWDGQIADYPPIVYTSPRENITEAEFREYVQSQLDQLLVKTKRHVEIVDLLWMGDLTQGEKK